MHQPALWKSPGADCHSEQASFAQREPALSEVEGNLGDPGAPFLARSLREKWGFSTGAAR